MSLTFTAGVPQGNQTIAQTTTPIRTNFTSLDAVFNGQTGGGSGGGTFTTFNFQNTTLNFVNKPMNPIATLYSVASASGNPELAWINNTNAVGASTPFTGVQITGGGITAAAWCTFSVSGSTATLNGNYNVTSVTRTAQGVYSIAFTRNFANAFYAAIITPNLNAPASFSVVSITQETKNVGSFAFSIVGTNNAGTRNVFTDPVSCDVVFFGILT